MNLNDLSFVDEEKKELAKRFIIKGGEMVIALTGATAGKMAIIPKLNQEILVNQRVGLVHPSDEEFNINKMPFVFGVLKSYRVNYLIKEFALGSAQPNISPKDLHKIKIAVPKDNYLIQQFNEKLISSYKLILEIEFENKKLKVLKDTLLPKLLSGEIEIPVESVVG